MLTKIVALPGSLRRDSSSHVVLSIISTIVPGNIDYEIFSGLGDLPHFNDRQETPKSVLDFKSKIKAAEGIVICTPEYAFGVPGALKNALDWTVGSGEFVGKPVALITASSQGESGHAALLKVLEAISADVPAERQLLLSSIRARLVNGVFKNQDDLSAVQDVMHSLLRAR